jgi:cysteine-rich CPCC protein
MTEPSITCSCCGYVTITDQFDRCPICGWIHEPVQQSDPDDDMGPNRISLRQAQMNFAAFGSKEEGARKREPTDRDKRDPNWKPLD